ncbi:uncharacterized protein PFL1_06337 [Pseudozyma flocculosa PF-1]|uniref:Histone deacetylase complex subunit SAP30 Sin3 binding domain-containing protein n=2 Tax=Pseudozyma flocculosa TaxID=84751 RepID=A0A5C3F7B9_9BASI|nr:uncharacterized protein PFL1_06337 [Pseudozyma flocculosa PF-1]EPQ26129.1 hypothetical protein PFL1_06337 [Pseudozyma flocculosa PF-1]SPO40374.1 uncharacterized protein PSFLO_05856 [Pseudozyma flocculosa]
MSASTDAKAAKAATKAAADDADKPFVDFASIPASALHSYISYYDLAQTYPPPDTTQSSSGGTSLSSQKGRRGSTRNVSPAPSLSGSRKRTADAAALDNPGSSNGTKASTSTAAAAAAAAEDDPPCPPHFFDADAASLYLSQVAAKHFASQPTPKEGEVVVGFLYKCKAKGELNRPLAHHRIKGPRIASGPGSAAAAASTAATARR